MSPREHAHAIWHAGLDAIGSSDLVVQNVCVDGDDLHLAGITYDLKSIDRIWVVGGGKAGAGMAAGFEAALGESVMSRTQLEGWVNVPEGCQRQLTRIHLHAARPAGVNEPREAGLVGTRRMLEMLESAGPRDLCVCLLSGGGSALLPAPVEGISLADKQQITRQLSAAGANIEQLNTVRKQLSRIKGGGLAKACKAGQLVTLIISDVLGDPLDVIASGPTVDNTTTAADALAVLSQFGLEPDDAPAVFNVLRQASRGDTESSPTAPTNRSSATCRNVIIGNNATAVRAAAAEAEQREMVVVQHAAECPEGVAEDVARWLLDKASQAQRQNPAKAVCLISGGEPVVQLVDDSQRGLGGRNQQLVLAAMDEIAAAKGAFAEAISPASTRWCLLSAGTDGEDGPTDAAGAFIDAEIFQKATQANLSPELFLARNDAYHLFAPLGGLVITGPTNTNVCDLRVVVILPE